MPEHPRILMVIHTRWSRSLGAPRVQLELGEELVRLGCQVEKFSYEDAFPRVVPPSTGRLGRIVSATLANRSFAVRAARYVRRRSEDFDIIDANQTDLPWPKPDLRFRGLLVARSVGLIPAYDEFERQQEERSPRRSSLHSLSHRLLSAPARRRRLRDVQSSFRFADLINVSNSDDLQALGSREELAGKVAHFPFGLSLERRQALSAARWPLRERQAGMTVAFVGTWNARKGARDWPRIVAAVRQRAPGAKFLFLGTSIPAEDVLGAFSPVDRAAVRAVPHYDAEALPGLLAGAAVGAFPGYLEGFGFGVLEKLAAGLPTVTYDAPGVRDTMRRFSGEWMVAPGDTDAFAARVVTILEMPEGAFAALSDQATRAAECFSWPKIARDTLTAYCDRFERLRR